MRRASTRDRTVDGSSVSCAAKVTGKLYSSTQSSSIGRAPEVPARTFAHMVSTSPPIGDVAPRPVITALRVISMPQLVVGHCCGRIQCLYSLFGGQEEIGRASCRERGEEGELAGAATTKNSECC